MNAATPMSGGLTRRRMIGLSAAVTAGMLAPASNVLADADSTMPKPQPLSGVSGHGIAAFARPPASVAPKFRWWWPNGQVDPDEIAREVDQVADAGFGGLEVADVHHSVAAGRLDVQKYGWGSPAWVTAANRALTQAKRRGITLDFTMGPSWPSAVPTITPDSVAASQELAPGFVTIAGGASFAGPVPPPTIAPASGANNATLLAVQAIAVAGPAVKAVTPLDPASLIDLTSAVVGTDRAATVSWTAPTGSSSWILIAYWQRGSGQQPEAGPHTSPTAYVVDHFSAAGIAAVTDFWEENILSAGMKRLLKESAVAFFEDSLEIETPTTIWTPGFPRLFTASRGYDILPYLSVLVEQKGKFLFTFDAATTTGVRDDYNTVLSELYRDHHLLVLRNWANRLGMKLRVQPYGLSTDSIAYAGLLDIPEGESLGFKNLDDYRCLAGGRDLGGRNLLSCESICYAGQAYNTTWTQALQTIGSFYAAGVNQTVIHGFAYADAPGATWPGFAAFSPYDGGAIGYGEAWGPRQPTWAHMSDIGRYLSRTQLVLQTGVPKYDIVFYRQKGYVSTGIGAPWATASGIPIGWTHGFLSSGTLDFPLAQVKGGVLAPEGPAYKALVLGPDQFTGGQYGLRLEDAEKLLAFSKAGLPIVVLGTWSPAVTGGRPDQAANAALAPILAELLARPNVRQVLDQNSIPDALAALGVTPAVTHDNTTLMHVHRVAGDTDLYYLSNAKHSEKIKPLPIDQSVHLTSTAADAVPYRLDAWTGEITPIAEYTRAGRTITVNVTLNAGEGTIVALAPASRSSHRTGDDVHAVSTEADSVRRDDRSLVIRDSTAGTYRTTLSDGRVRTTTIGPVPAPIPMTAWSLQVEDWQPGAAVTSTIKPLVAVDLPALVPWSSVPAIQDASGIGHYRTTVTLPRTWSSTTGAVLDLGVVNGTFRVKVNGRAADPTSVLRPRIDLGGLLRPGPNVIEVEVASTLLNRLRTVTPAVYGVAARQSYGLLGPVQLLPYVEAVVR
ncbi:Glycosyl hydrolases family 2, sugar binding domain [Nakamurella panacisegetis]|uniref:Glycosyl hydrolases family 2, sugar binding domain n=1 Tax=Nakamurella panacisegetis TaxID=1090615 RepID=A0A1H0N3F5_9ACTN|nr:glycosyl hydrolase [Nakamurella panacisegetis]SDO87046.1 Glycosyl hydrolases family 2, sugar binding domain [Nakamurella panacisegetis]